MKWTDNLPGAVYERLCGCKTKKNDVATLVNAKWNDMKKRGLDLKGYTKEDAVVSILDLLDANGQYYDITKEEYDNLKK